MAGRKRRRYIKWTALILLIGMTCIFGCLAMYYKDYNKEAYDRQTSEEDLADLFIQDMMEQAFREDEEPIDEETLTSKPDNTNSKQETEETIDNRIYREEIQDEIYFERNGITYTPDYAVGSLQCVLEYPACKIRRGVYTGSWSEIAFDLDIWMATASRPDYELGKTHYCIYGHNHTSQNLSFNNLKEASIGDEFVLYGTKAIYFYEVTDIFAEWRETAASKYVHNFGIDKSKCYIITCGRDNFLLNGQSTRYKDFLVEGTLTHTMTWKEYRQTYKTTKE